MHALKARLRIRWRSVVGVSGLSIPRGSTARRRVP